MPHIDFVKSILEIDDAAGGLRWKARYGRAWPGDLAGAGITPGTGYRRIRLEDKTYAVGRLVWLLHTGEDPGKATIRHLDGDPMNDRFNNLALKPLSGPKKAPSAGDLTPG